MKTNKQTKIGDIVTLDFRAAEIFKNAGIDFCCGGSQTLGDACRDKNLDVAAIETQLEQLENSAPDSSHMFNEWKLDFLSDYIVNTHHQTVMNLLPQLTFYTQKIAEVHGNNHPELLEIAGLFAQVDTECCFPGEREYADHLQIVRAACMPRGRYCIHLRAPHSAGLAH